MTKKIHEVGVITVVNGLGLFIVVIWCCSGRNYWI